jgi:hypothetical protein
MTPERKKELEDWLKKFWFLYPNDLTEGKKGSKPKAISALWKLKPDNDELERIWQNTLAKKKSDEKIKAKGGFVARWPMISTYFNQAYFDADIPTDEEVEANIARYVCECGQPAGPKWKGKRVCVECYVGKCDDIWKKDLYQMAVTLDGGILIKPNESKQEYNTRMRDLAFSKGLKQIRKEGFVGKDTEEGPLFGEHPENESFG